MVVEFASAIVGLAAIGAQVGKVVYNLIETLHDAPKELLALSDEITDFRAILLHLIEAQGSREFASQGLVGDLEGVTRKCEAILRDIERHVQSVVKEKGIPAGSLEVSRIRWLHRVKKAQKLQQALRVQKATISNFLAIGVVKSSATHGLLITELKTQIDSIAQSQLSLMEKQDTMLTALQLESPSQLGRNTGPSQPKKLLFPATSMSVAAASAVGPTRALTRRSRSPLMCHDECECRCHYKAIVRSPKYLSQYLGNLIVGCSSLPWCFSGFVECNEQSCRRSRFSSTDIKYFMPVWLSNNIATWSININFRPIPVNVSLNSRHMIPYDSPILVCTQEGDIDGMRRLLKSGEASLNDIDPYGLGLIYYAVYYAWRAVGKDRAMKTCQFLLDMGAHQEWQDEIGNTPAQTMVDDTIVSLAGEGQNRRPLEPSDFLHVSLLFGISTAEIIDDLFEERGFTLVHQVLLGIRQDLGTLEQFLSNRHREGAVLNEMDTLDACGRSPLTWAVEYGWTGAVRVLLQFGADPNQLRPSLHGNSPLLHLSIAGPASDSEDSPVLQVIRLMLQAGADINAVDHEGWTPLHVAASWNNYPVIKELASFGGDDLAWDKLTDDGESAMDLSRANGYSASVEQILVGHGVGSPTDDGSSHNDSGSDVFVDCLDDLTLNEK